MSAASPRPHAPAGIAGAIPRELHALVDARYAALVEACRDARVAMHDDAGVEERVRRVLLASDFAFDALRREPQLLGAQLTAFFNDQRHAGARAAGLAGGDAADFPARLRAFRRRESLRLVWRDVTGVDSVEATLAGASELAETCIDAALARLVPEFEARYGTPRAADGTPQRLVVLGMGKLGGGELNFSSDIDLIFAFPEQGQCDGARGVANEDFFARLGQKLIQVLADVTADGFVYRVDMRLRPFGTAGRMALSFAAMEQYYQRDGRDWERYAWIKAKPVGGDRAAGARLVAQLKPFVYRRYLDYTAIDGLRAMKALIDAEVARKDLEDHIKLGPGGIREIEFIVQLAQLIRGGREAVLRTPSLLEAFAALERLGLMRSSAAQRLREAYRFLRRLENRLQMLRDDQVHELPQDAQDRARIAAALGHADWPALVAALDVHRRIVAEEFADTLSPGRARTSTISADWARVWAEAMRGETPAGAGAFGGDALAELVAHARGAGMRAMEPKTRARLDRLWPQLLAAAAAAPSPDASLTRLVRLVQAIGGRPSYLALLEEQPAARERVVDVFARSAFLAERVIAQPLLLDELLDVRLEAELPDAGTLPVELARHTAELDGDAEEQLVRIAEVRHGAAFRLGLAWLGRRLDADATAARLADVASAVVGETLRLAERDAIAQHGVPEGAAEGTGLLVVGYGSLGGAELGFASDLDLVFIFDSALSTRTTTGQRPVEGSRYFARLAQRLVHWLTTATRAGKLYDVDVRLRPDGAKGLLVTTIDAFAEYQHERAWLWEHQALVRARPIAGDPRLAARYDAIRAGVLAKPRDAATLRRDVHAMRERWRTELDRSDAARFDIKQGRGGLVDLEFLLQALVLDEAARKPDVAWPTRTVELIEALATHGVLAADEADALAGAHDALAAASLDRTLDAAPRVVADGGALRAHADAVLRVAAAHGLDFL